MAVQWKINVTTLLLIAGIAFILIVSPFNCHSGASHSSLHSAIKWLVSNQYQQADPVTEPKPDNIPPDIKPVIISTVSGSGVWIPEIEYEPGDSVEVELSVVELIDESAWIKVTIDSVEVKWQKLEHYHTEVQRKWTLYAEVANCESRYGVGIGYRIWKPLEINVSPAVSVSTSLDWIAPELVISRNVWSGVSIGAGCGYRFGADDGLHLSAGLGVEL